jgi:hypothetical protein
VAQVVLSADRVVCPTSVYPRLIRNIFFRKYFRSFG